MGASHLYSNFLASVLGTSHGLVGGCTFDTRARSLGSMMEVSLRHLGFLMSLTSDSDKDHHFKDWDIHAVERTFQNS